MCESDVPIPVCIRGNFACFNAAATMSISFYGFVSPQTMAFLTTLLISETDKNHQDSKQKPASMISTPISSNHVLHNKFLICI
jgi:hypothetical protein